MRHPLNTQIIIHKVKRIVFLSPFHRLTLSVKSRLTVDYNLLQSTYLVPFGPFFVIEAYYGIEAYCEIEAYYE